MLDTGKLLAAWTQTPTKWYPLPLAVGALLLVALQYRHKLARTEKQVHVDDKGHEVIKLKGPWQVSPSSVCRKNRLTASG
jgi:phosphatidylserine decarboxylase